MTPQRKKQLLFVGLLLCPLLAHAAYTPVPTQIPSNNTLDGFVLLYKNKANLWQATIVNYTRYTFWCLAIIEFAWTASMMALRNADIQEWTVTVIKRIMCIGFFYALFVFGPVWSKAIIDSFLQISNDASIAAGGTANISPSSLFDMGADLFLDVTSHLGFLHVVEGICAVFCGLILCIALAITCAYLTIAIIETYIAISAGIVLLGFGASRWTRDWAIGYLKYSVATGFKLFLTQLIIAIGGAIIADWMAYAHANPSTTTIPGLMLLAAVCIVQAMMVGKIPGMAQAMIQGGSTAGGDEAGSAGRIAGSAAMVASGVGSAAIAAKSAASSTIGAGRAIKAATSQANAATSWNAGMGAGNRVQGAVSKLTGSSSLGQKAGSMASKVSRAGQVAGSAMRTLASQSKKDYMGRNDGTVRNFGTLGGRIANAIEPKKNS